jgi:accessory gene regulator protein AgrB
LTSELNEIFTKADAQTNDSTILAEQPVERKKKKEFIFFILILFDRFVMLIMLKQVIQMPF